MPSRPWVRVSSYLALVFSFSAIFYSLCFQHGKTATYTFGLMWCPAIAAVLTSLFTKRPWRDFGWRLGKSRYLLAGWAIPLVYLWPAYLLIWATGIGGFPKEQQVERIRSLLHIHSGPTWAPLMIYYLIGSVAAVLFGCIGVVGEEIGWRGLLVPELIKVTSFTRTSLISGVIWSAWHAPLIVLDQVNSGGAPLWYSLASFTILTTAASFVFVWLTVKSGSLWPAVLMHASNNAMLEGYFTPLTIERTWTRYFAATGGAMLPFILFCAWMAWRNAAGAHGRETHSAEAASIGN